VQAICQNLGGGHYGCKCKPGFLGDGVTCKDDPNAVDTSASDALDRVDMEQQAQARALGEQIERITEDQDDQASSDQRELVTELKDRVDNVNNNIQDLGVTSGILAGQARQVSTGH